MGNIADIKILTDYSQGLRTNVKKNPKFPPDIDKKTQELKLQEIQQWFKKLLKKDDDWQTTYHTKNGQPLSGIQEVVVKPGPKRKKFKGTNEELDKLLATGKWKIHEKPVYNNYRGNMATLTPQDLDKAISAIIPAGNLHGIYPTPGNFIQSTFIDRRPSKMIDSGLENLAFFSGPVGNTARFLLGAKNLAGPNGVSKTFKEYNNGNIVGGTTSLVGDLLNFSVMRPGFTRLLKSPRQTVRSIKREGQKFNREMTIADNLINSRNYKVQDALKAWMSPIFKYSGKLIGKSKPVDVSFPNWLRKLSSKIEDKIPFIAPIIPSSINSRLHYQSPINVSAMVKYDLAQKFKNYDDLLIESLKNLGIGKKLSDKEAKEIVSNWDLQTKAEALGVTVEEYKKSLEQNSQQTSPETLTPRSTPQPVVEAPVTETTTPTEVYETIAEIPDNIVTDVSTTAPQIVSQTTQTTPQVTSQDLTSSKGSENEISMEDLMKNTIKEYLANGNQINGISSLDDINKLEPQQIEDVYHQIQRVYTSQAGQVIEEQSEQPKQETLVIDNSDSLGPVNRADVRALIENDLGINPYSLSASQRKALRKYLNGDRSQDVSWVDKNSRLYNDFIAPFTVYKKNGGILISRNIINRFKNDK